MRSCSWTWFAARVVTSLDASTRRARSRASRARPTWATCLYVYGDGPSHGGWAEQAFPLAPRLLSFPFFSTAPSLFVSIFPGKPSNFPGSEPSLRLVWAQNQPNRQNTRVFCWKPPGIPGKYPATAWVSCRFPQFCLRFCPRPALRLRETREFPEWSTKHPLFSLEISGNAKCWGPSVFLFVCRKSLCRPSGARRGEAADQVREQGGRRWRLGSALNKGISRF